MSLARAARFAVLALVVAGASGCGSKKHAHRARAKLKREATARANAVPRPPPPPPPPPQAADGTSTVGGVRYIEIVTGGARSSDTLPMIFAMHGHGGSADQFQRSFDGAQFRARFIVAFGTTEYEAHRFEWFPRAGHRQHEMARALPSAVARIATAVTELVKVRPTSGKPIVTGFSQGAIMSYALALLRPAMFSVACPMSGEIPAELIRGARLPPVRPEVHGFHGDQDHIVDFSSGRETIAGLKRLGYTADLKVLHGVAHKYEPATNDVLRCLENAARGAAASRP